jgi:glycosyltransferase 2 family protein
MGDKTKSATWWDQDSVRQKKIWFMLRLLLGLCLIGLIVYFVDFYRLLNIIVKANPCYLFAIMVLVYVDRLVMAYKWNQLLHAVDVRIPLYVLFRAYAIAPLTNAVLPSTIGGDLFRLYSLSGYKADTKAVFASMVVERVIAFAAVLLLAGLGLVLMIFALKNGLLHVVSISTALIMGAGLVAGLIGSIHPESRRYAEKLATRFAVYPLVGKVHQIYTLCCEYRKHWRTVATVSVWTLIEQMFPTVGNTLAVWALHIDVPVIVLVAITPLSLLISRLPLTIDSLGVQEGVYVALFGWVGISASEAFLVSMVGRAVSQIALLPWGIHYIYQGR